MNVKGAAGSLMNLVHWFGAWAVSYTFNFLFHWSSSGQLVYIFVRYEAEHHNHKFIIHIGCYISGTFFIYSGFCAAAVLFVAILVPETKGRTLEEIQASINN